MFLRFKPVILEIEVTDLQEKFFAVLSEYDLLHLKLSAKLLKFFQITEERDKNIPLLEQLKWAFHSKLEKPLEDYYYDFQIFNEDNELQATACAIERESLDGFLKDNNFKNVYLVNSEDNQFVFIRNSVSFWRQENFLSRVNNIALLSGGVLALAALLILGVNNKYLTELKNKRGELDIKLSSLETKAAQAAASELLEKEIGQNLKQNETLVRLLYRVTSLLPRQIILNELVFNEDENKILFSGCAPKGFSLNSKLTAKLEAIKEIGSIKVSHSLAENGQIVFDYELLLKIFKANNERKDIDA